MFKYPYLKTTALALLAIISLAFITNLEYKNVAEGKLKILVPTDFVYNKRMVSGSLALVGKLLQMFMPLKIHQQKCSFFQYRGIAAL